MTKDTPPLTGLWGGGRIRATMVVVRLFTLLIFLQILALLGSYSHADVVVISGRPLTKVESSSKGTKQFSLNPEQQSEYGLIILKRGDSYFWASREMKPLTHSVSGAFHYFINPNGGGYIKVVDRRLLMEEKNPRFLYMEHLTLWMQTLTYWGAAEEFSP